MSRAASPRSAALRKAQGMAEARQRRVQEMSDYVIQYMILSSPREIHADALQEDVIGRFGMSEWRRQEQPILALLGAREECRTLKHRQSLLDKAKADMQEADAYEAEARARELKARSQFQQDDTVRDRLAAEGTRLLFASLDRALSGHALTSQVLPPPPPDDE